MISNAVLIAVALAHRFEGCYLRPYLCPAGVPTVGYGATFYENGVRVTLADPPISRERAETLLLWMIRTRYLPAVLILCPHLDSPGRLAAIIDFAFNLGTGALRTSTLRRKINVGNWDDVCSELKRWDKAGGLELVGLKKRRAAEVVLVSGKIRSESEKFCTSADQQKSGKFSDS